MDKNASIKSGYDQTTIILSEWHQFLIQGFNNDKIIGLIKIKLFPETENMLFSDGGRIEGPDGKSIVTFDGNQWGRIMEVTHDKNSEFRYSVYKAQRFRSLYLKLDHPKG